MEARVFDKRKLPSRHVTKGPEHAPHRSYYYAMGLSSEQIHQPFVGVATCWNEAAPCNISLMRQAQAVKKGVAAAGGTPREFCTITVTDGIAMGHQGMKASLVSREVIADSVEVVMQAERLDGSVLLAGCDKSLPGMLMAAARLDLASVFLYAGSIMPGQVDGNDVTIIDAFEAVGACLAGKITREEVEQLGRPLQGSRCAKRLVILSQGIDVESLAVGLLGGVEHTSAAIQPPECAAMLRIPEPVHQELERALGHLAIERFGPETVDRGEGPEDAAVDNKPLGLGAVRAQGTFKLRPPDALFYKTAPAEGGFHVTVQWSCPEEYDAFVLTTKIEGQDPVERRLTPSEEGPEWCYLGIGMASDVTQNSQPPESYPVDSRDSRDSSSLLFTHAREMNGGEVREKDPQEQNRDDRVNRVNPVNGNGHSTCPHPPDQIVETPTFDGYVNRQCRVCGEDLQCRKATP